MLKVAFTNFPLIRYLVGELTKTHSKKVDSLRVFVPTAKDEDWTLIQAGQRAQVMKKDPQKGGVLQFGTEVVASRRRLDRGSARRVPRRIHGGLDHAQPPEDLLPRPHRGLGACAQGARAELRRRAELGCRRRRASRSRKTAEALAITA